MDAKLMIINIESKGIETLHSQVMIPLEELDISHRWCLFLPMDPALGSNFATEAKVIYDRYNPDLVIFVPADPQRLFTTICGVQRWNRVAICKTELAMDPECPIMEDDIRRIIEEAFEKTIHLIKLPMLRSSENLFRENGIYVCDAENSKDLTRIAIEIKNEQRNILVIGTNEIADIIENL